MQAVELHAAAYTCSRLKNIEKLKMPTTIRLSDKEQEDLRKKAIEINKILIKAGQEPLRDSELAHAILESGLPMVRIDNSGKIYLEEE